MGDELLGDLALGAVPLGAHRLGAALGDQGLVALEEFLDLHRVIGERLGRGVDRGQAAADHHDRQAHGQIGDAVGLGGAGQLQAPSGNRRPGAPRATRPFCIGITVGRPAPAHSAIWSKPRAKAPSIVSVPPKRTPPYIAKPGAALEQEADHLQEILVPAHRDAVFGDPAEPGHRCARRAARRGSRHRGPARTARARRSSATPEISGGSGSILSPSIAATKCPSLIR